MGTREVAAFRRAIEGAPCSIRRLAEAAGVSHTLLLQVRDGDRRLTPATRRAVISALRSWGDRCHGLADALEDAAESETGGIDG